MDWKTIKTWAIFGRPFSKGLKDARLEYKYDGRSMEQTVNELDGLFTKIMYKIKDQYDEYTVFGLGLSGGWDSRLVLHYALKVGINPSLFCFGDIRPNKLLVSYDWDSVRKICKIYNLDTPKIIRIHNKPDEEFFNRDCKENPFTNYNIWRYHTYQKELPEFDVLLSGFDGGENFGQTIPSTIYDMNSKDLAGFFLSRLGGCDSPVYGVISEDEYKNIFIDLVNFIESFENNIDAFQSFLCRFMCKNNDTFDSISIFKHPLFQEEVKNWKPEWLVGNNLQKAFYRSVLPKLAKIHCQNRSIPYYFSDNKISNLLKFWYLGWYLIRGRMLHYPHIVKSNGFQNFARDVSKSNNDLFNNFFDVDALKSISFTHAGNGGLFNNCLKIKKVLDEGVIEK